MVLLDPCPSADRSKADTWETQVGGKEIGCIEDGPEKREGLPALEDPVRYPPRASTGGKNMQAMMGRRLVLRGHRGLASPSPYSSVDGRIILLQVQHDFIFN